MNPTSFELWPSGAPSAKGATSEDRPRLTPYLLSGADPAACVIVCPGGGYGGRAPHEAEPISRWLNSIGIASFVLDYRVAPYRHPVPLQDAQRAIRIIRSRAREFNISPDRIGILGFSAGGHLAGSAATIFDAGNPAASDSIDRVSCRPDCAVLCYPVLTFGEFRNDGTMRNLLGAEPAENQRQEMSLENRVTANTPPTFMWHTADDAVVPVENVLIFAAALHRHQVPFALHVFPTGRHGLGLAADHAEVNLWTSVCDQWMRAIGFRK